MANRTVKDAKSIHGTNPQYLVEKIIRSRIYDSKYWKEECFALTAELLVDKGMELRYIGGVFGGNIKPTPFMCLILKMLQIQPEKDIIVEFIKNDEFKYVRALGAFYMRLTGTSLDCYNYLEPLFNDNRKLRRQNRSGAFEIVYMDDFIDELLREERSCDVILPRLQKRYVMEQNNELQPRVSVLEDDEDDDDDLEEMEEGEAADDKPSTSKSAREDKSSKSNSRHERRYNSDSSDDEYRRRKDRRDRRDDRSPDSSRRRDRDRDYGRRDRDSSRDRKRRHSKDRDYDDKYGSSSRRHDDYRRDRDEDRRRKDHDRDRRDRDRHRDRDRDRHRSRHDY